MSEHPVAWWFFVGMLFAPFLVGGIVLGKMLWERWRHPDLMVLTPLTPPESPLSASGGHFQQ